MPLSKKALRIDKLIQEGHFCLTENDECYFFGEYTSREKFSFSPTNDLIQNLKKTPDKQGLPEWQHKIKAINASAELIQSFIKKDTDITFVPVPPSKTKDDPIYDDRLLKVLQIFSKDWQSPDIRELIIQVQSRSPVHERQKRPTVDEMISMYQIDKNLIAPIPKKIIIFDDVITTGCQFKAIKTILSEQYPNTEIIGLFIARTIFRN